MNKIIAIDGTAGSGKGTIAKHIAKEIGYFYLDTGAFYRAVSYLIIKNNISLGDIDTITNLVRNLNIEFKDYMVLVNGNDVTNEIRSKDVNAIVSIVADILEVRLLINDKIRKYIGNKDYIVDGRDVGTVIFPNADFKFYLDASIDTRARRRFNQLTNMGNDANFEKILENIQVRDKIDKTREFGALIMADDAILIDTTNDEIEDTLRKMIEIMRRK